MTDLRKQQLTDWLKTLPWPPNGELISVSGDASFRRYFRFLHDATWRIAVDAPPPHESLQPFMAISNAYAEAGIRVPNVHAFNEAEGFMVLDDLGDDLLFGQLADEADARQWYAKALSALPAIMRCRDTELGLLPAYDEALLQRELSLFSDWLVEKHLGIRLTSAQQVIWQKTCSSLIGSALEQPQVGVHRDYHSRNLMVTTDSNLGVIDFQDAVRGPVTYDAVSLLRDCYIKWPASMTYELLADFTHRLRVEGLLDQSISDKQFCRWFDWMGIQRHLKASGIFARLNHRDNKPGYLADMPRTLSYIKDVSAKYPELNDFYHLLCEVVLPAMEQSEHA